MSSNLTYFNLSNKSKIYIDKNLFKLFHNNEILNIKEIIFIKDNNLSCTSLHITQDKKLIEEIRLFIKKKYEKHGYTGFSSKYDLQFDLYSTYFYVFNKKNQLIATQRIIHKFSTELLPIEKGIIQNTINKHYKINESNIVEITSFVFNDIKSIKFLSNCVASYGRFYNIKKAFALLDINSNSLKKIYEKLGWINSKKYSTPIYFPNYGKISNNKFQPTLWQILELNEEKIMELSQNIYTFKLIRK